LDPRAFLPSGDLLRQYYSGRASADLDRAFPTVIELVIHAHAAQSGMGGLEPIQGKYSSTLGINRIFFETVIALPP
jgi:hypothetical protein